MAARIGEVLSFKRVSTDESANLSEVQVDLGGGNKVTARHFSLPGDDSAPLVGEFALCSQVGSEWIAYAFMDPSFAPLAAAGERVLTSRSGLGAAEAKIHLKADGSVVINDKVTITADGAIVAQGDISSDGEVTAMAQGPGVTLSQHLHDTGVGPTAPPTPGT